MERFRLYQSWLNEDDKKGNGGVPSVQPTHAYAAILQYLKKNK